MMMCQAERERQNKQVEVQMCVPSPYEDITLAGIFTLEEIKRITVTTAGPDPLWRDVHADGK